MAPAATSRTVQAQGAPAQSLPGPVVTHQNVARPLQPAWWALLLGALAVALVTAGAWKGLKIIRERGRE